MKSVALLTCCFWIVAPLLCHAQSAAPEKVNADYYICIHEIYADVARTSADRTVLFNEVEKKCKPQRDAAYAAAIQMGKPAETAEKNARDFTNQIFVAAEVDHSEIIGLTIKSISFFRGSTEFCDNAIKSKTQAKEQEYRDRLADSDIRFQDKPTLSRVTNLYYDRRIRFMVEKYGAKKFCSFAKVTLRDLHPDATDYFE